LYEVNQHQKEHAILVGVTQNSHSRGETEEHLEELSLLADTVGAEVIETFIQEKDKIDPAYFIGRGKAEMISNRAIESNADMLIFDDDLSPAQVRNLERLSGKKVLDRSGLILDIFAHRAKTKEARTQVELAQLNYLLPRLTRQWTHLSRQVGGIGTRGPGETQLEVDRRLIRARISLLNKELDKIKNQRAVRRRGRELIMKVALVGYTNAGKSTVLNALTQSEVFVEDRLFATLDSTVRRMKVANHSHVLLIDTVGFIRKLPHHLVASFMSTLEEARVADVLVHVVDISHPHFFDHIRVVKDVLNQLQIATKPTLYVFNKIDRLPHDGLLARLRNEFEPAVFVSAISGDNLPDLKNEIDRLISRTVVDIEVEIDLKYPELVSKIYDLAQVLEAEYNEQRVRMKFRTTHEQLPKIQYLLQEKINGQAA